MVIFSKINDYIKNKFTINRLLNSFVKMFQSSKCLMQRVKDV